MNQKRENENKKHQTSPYMPKHFLCAPLQLQEELTAANAAIKAAAEDKAAAAVALPLDWEGPAAAVVHFAARADAVSLRMPQADPPR